MSVRELYMSKVSREVRVRDMLVDCTYTDDPAGPKAASDGCGGWAFTTVQLPSGDFTYRCALHKGLLPGGAQKGPVNTSMIILEEVAEPAPER